MFLAGLFDIVPNRSSRLQKGEIKKIYICGLKMFSNKTYFLLHNRTITTYTYRGSQCIQLSSITFIIA